MKRRKRASTKRRTGSAVNSLSTTAKPLSKPEGNRSTTITNTLKKGQTPQEATAELVVEGVSHNVHATAVFTRYLIGDTDLTELMAAQAALGVAVQHGDLRVAENLLMSQAVTLNAIFTNLATLSDKDRQVGHMERLLRLALKAQSQCRTTCETLAALRSPRAVFARQANIANGPQQVNNGVPPPPGGSQERSPARNETAPNELMEAPCRTAGHPSGASNKEPR